MSRQYPNVFSPHVAFIHHYIPYSESTPSLQHISRQHLYYLWLGSTLYLLPMSSQYTISPAHVQSVYHLSSLHPVRIPTQCPCPVRITSLLPLLSQITSYSAHGQSVHNHSTPYPVSIPSPHPMFSQYTISPAHVQSVHNLAYPCPVTTPPLCPLLPVRILPILSMSS